MPVAPRVKKAFGGQLRPAALVGHPMEAAAAGAGVSAVTVCFVLELLTPDDVIGASALVPLLGAVWLLSTRFVLLVTGVALAEFGIALLAENSGRPTMVVIGAVGAWVLLSARLYATAEQPVAPGNRRVRSVGPSVRTAPTAGPNMRTQIDALSSRELEVARLASRGHTASEIGRMLHIGERTVETHVGHIYSKLGIQSRRQLLLMRAELDQADG